MNFLRNIYFSLSAIFIFVCLCCMGFPGPEGDALADNPWDHRTTTFKKQLGGTVSYRIETTYQQAHPKLPLLHTIDHDDETNDFSQITFHPQNDNILYSTSWDGFIRKWDVEAGDELATFAVPGSTLLEGLLFHEDTNEFLSYGENGWLAIHNADDLTLNEQLTVNLPQIFYRTAALNPDNDRFCLGRSDGFIEFWSWRERRKLGELKIHDWPVQKLSFDETGKFLFSADATEVILYDLNQIGPVRNLVTSEPVNGIKPFWFSSFSFSQNSDFVVAGTYRDTKVFNLKTAQVEMNFTGPTMGLISSWLIENNTKLFSISRDLSIRIYNTEDRSLLEERWLPLPLFAIASSIVTSPNMKFVAMTSQEPSFSRMGSIPRIRLFRFLP